MPQDVAEGATLQYFHRFTPEARRIVDDYIERTNARQAPAKLTLRDLINAALLEYVARRDDDAEAA
jgi:hypothetical protein